MPWYQYLYVGAGVVLSVLCGFVLLVWVLIFLWGVWDSGLGERLQGWAHDFWTWVNHY